MVINGVRGAAMAMGEAVTSVGKQASLSDLNRAAMVALQVAASLPKQTVTQALRPAVTSAPVPTATRSAVIVARADVCPEPPYGFQGSAEGARLYYGPDGRTVDRAATQAYFACLNAHTPQAPAPVYAPEAPPAAPEPYEYPSAGPAYSYPSSADGYAYPTAGPGPGGASGPSADMAPERAAKPAGTVQAGAPAAEGTSTATYVGIGAGVVALGALLYFATR